MNRLLHIVAASPTARLYGKFTALYVAIGLLLRIVLIFNPLTQLSGTGALPMVLMFIIGAANDAFAATIGFVPMWAFCMSACRGKFARPAGFWWLGALASLLLVLLFAARPIVEFNAGLHTALCWLTVFWAATFALRMFMPRLRDAWIRFWLAVIIGVYLMLLVFDAMGEWLFWDEFGVRYNFIAVDYLVYTNEVVGNIVESYPVGWLVAAIIVVAAALEYVIFRKDIAEAPRLHTVPFPVKTAATTLFLLAVGLSLLLIRPAHRLELTGNVFCNELKASGPYSFAKAFFSNTIEYEPFYITSTPRQMEADLNRALAPNFVTAADTASELLPNIVLITMESMSADYMERFGGDKHLTPTLDSLYLHSIAFDRLFAAGNRTVRGLEALTLSRPPAPGESIIKRPDNQGYPSIADILRHKGYSLTFLYGGDSYFDNMESFFSGLGYRIMDDSDFTPAEQTFRTVWGICDGDVYGKLASLADSAVGERPFFIHMLTTSNHRPYLYPEGKISIPPTEKTRSGGVMYSDFALGEFLEQARQREWFGNTVFVICADHCASSAGSTDLPLENYHIPALIYSPGLFGTDGSRVEATSSQIDLMPTLFALLGWSYDNNLYGRDILAPDYPQRAFLATYQDMGYLSRDTLTVLSPGKKSRQYEVERPFGLKRVETPTGESLSETVSLYQRSSTSR